jgi:hypothetical protein
MVHVVLLSHLAARKRADRPTAKSNVSPTLSSDGSCVFVLVCGGLVEGVNGALSNGNRGNVRLTCVTLDILIIVTQR